MEGEFDLKFCNGVSFVWERERERERERELLGFLDEKQRDPRSTLWGLKFSSCPNHVVACGPKIQNRVLETRFVNRVSKTRFTCGELARLTSINWLFKGRGENRVLETWFPRGEKAKSESLRTWKPSLKGLVYKPKIEPFRLEMLVCNIVWKRGQ